MTRSAHSILTLFLVQGSLGLVGCMGGKSGQDSATSCTDLPTAAAGDDQSIALGSQAALDAAGSASCDADSGGAIYTWTVQTVPAESAVTDASLSANKSADAIGSSFLPDMVGDYVLGLSLTDSQGDSNTDVVVIHVAAADGAPAADCGGDQTGAVGTAVTMNAGASTDPENAVLEYGWSLTGPACSGLGSASLYNTAGATPSFVPDCAGLYHISLVVSDSVQWSDPTICTVDVADGNHVPVSDAGDSQDLGGCADNPMQLNGSGSYDLDGDAMIFAWTTISVPGSSLVDDSSISDTTAERPTVNWDQIGSYTFQLTVGDGQSLSAPDVVTLTVGAYDAATYYPAANAGADQTISSEADCETASYVWTCEECPSIEIDLDGSSSSHSQGAPVTYHWTEPSGGAVFSHPFGVYTTATLPAIPAEYGVDTTNTYEIDLGVSDCQQTDHSTVTVTYTCTGIHG
jgi:hypothetical protein